MRRLAALHGVQLSHRNAMAGSRGRASPETLLAALRALEVPVASPADVPGALRERLQEPWRQGLEPVVVAWDGGPAALDLRLPAGRDAGRAVFELHCEGGETRRWRVDIAAAARRGAADIEGTRYVVRRTTLPGGLPPGYHRLRVEVARRSLGCLVIAAPRAAYAPRTGPLERHWGVFLPLYALRTRRNWGAGDFSDLQALMEWVAQRGGSVVATLPLLAAFLDDPLEPSPYSPVSRLFWNEFYLDVERIRGDTARRPVRGHPGPAALQRELGSLRRAPLIDYRRGMAVKRRILAALARRFFARPHAEQAGLRDHLRANPMLEEYARFRAAQERRRAPWTAWPARQRDGDLRPGDYDEAARRYHLFAQWHADAQIGAVSRRSRECGPGLYLDLPLGVHPEGFDVWRYRSAFARGASGGSPPDAFFTRGQDWGFPPPHPDRIREGGYDYTIACVQSHLRHAGILRIDHVMALHRLFWVPAGMQPRQGVYVRYRAEEMYAILSLESHRTRTLIVGEDLGSVPRDVRPAMERHGIQRMYVLQYELAPVGRQALRPVPAGSLAALNTHDMPTFAAFWSGRDIRDRVELGLLDRAAAGRERRSRTALRRSLAADLGRRGWLPAGRRRPQDILRACLAYLGAGRAHLVVAGLEDLWGESQPQNTPATGVERPNWRRKARYNLESFSRMARVVRTLRALDRSRRRIREG